MTSAVTNARQCTLKNRIRFRFPFTPLSVQYPVGRGVQAEDHEEGCQRDDEDGDQKQHDEGCVFDAVPIHAVLSI